MIIILTEMLVLNVPITLTFVPSLFSSSKTSEKVNTRTHGHRHAHTRALGCIYSPPCVVEEQGNVETHSQPLLGTQEHDAEQSVDGVLW